MKKTTSALSLLLALLMLFSMTVGAAGDKPLTLTSAMVGENALENASIAASDTIVLTFSNNVTDASVLTGNISKISVKNAENTKQNITVGTSGNNALTVTFVDIKKGDYTLTIGKDLAAKNGNTLGTKVEIAFAINKGNGTGGGGGTNPLSFVSATVEGVDVAGKTLSGNETIVLQFDRGMKIYETENAAYIAVYTANGAKAAYTVLPVDDSTDDTKRTVSVQLGDLADGDYTLKIGKKVQANNGNTLGTDVTVAFSVQAPQAEQPTPTEPSDSTEPTNRAFSIFEMIANLFRQIIEFFQTLFK